MKNLTFSFLLLLLAAMVFTSCKKDEKKTNTPAQIAMEKQDYYPFEAAFVDTENLSVADGEYAGKIDETNVTLIAVNGSLTVIIPDIGAGKRTLTVALNGQEYAAAFNLLASPAVPNPDAVVQLFEQKSTTVASQLAQYADSLEATERATLLSHIHTLQQHRDSVMQQYYSLSDEEKTICARYLSANEWWINEIHQATNDLLIASFSGKRNNEIDDYEAQQTERMKQFTNSKITLVKHLRRVVVFTVGGGLIGSGLGMAVGAGIGIGLLMSDLKNHEIAQNELVNHAFLPFENILASGKTGSYVSFMHNAEKQLDIKMSYRSIYYADNNSPASLVKTFVTNLDDVKSAWDKLKSYISLSFLFSPKTVNDIPVYNTDIRNVNSKYLSVSNINNPDISLVNVNRTNGYLALTLQSNKETKQYFSFSIEYNSDFGSHSNIVDADISEGEEEEESYSLIGSWNCIYKEPRPPLMFNGDLEHMTWGYDIYCGGVYHEGVPLKDKYVYDFYKLEFSDVSFTRRQKLTTYENWWCTEEMVEYEDTAPYTGSYEFRPSAHLDTLRIYGGDLDGTFIVYWTNENEMALDNILNHPTTPNYSERLKFVRE